MQHLKSCFVLLLALVAFASGTHYRYGTISWVANGRNVTFSMETAWRRSYFSPLPNVGSVISIGTSFIYGDGSSTSTAPLATVTTVNTNEDWVIATTTLSHVYTANTKSSSLPWVAYFSGSARISTLKNNADKDWSLTTTVNCSIPSSPISKMLPIANVLFTNNYILTFIVPSVATDNLPIHFKLGTSSQICGSSNGCNNPASLTVDALTGVVTWNVQNLATGLYCAVIMIGNDYVSVPVDFIINYKQVPGQCGSGCANAGKNCILPGDCGTCSAGCVKPQPPSFISPTPSYNDSLEVSATHKISFDVVASSPQSSYSVTIQQGALPTGATLSSNSGSNPVTRTFTWVPTATQVGSYIVCFSAMDNLNFTTPQYCLTISVSPKSCDPPCSANSYCDVPSSSCICLSGYMGVNCSDFGGSVHAGTTIYGGVAYSKTNYYYFDVTGNAGVKIIEDTLDHWYDTCLYVSTTTATPGMFDNIWDSVANQPNVITIPPSDPDFIVGRYYVGVYGWFVPGNNLADYNLTVYM